MSLEEKVVIYESIEEDLKDEVMNVTARSIRFWDLFDCTFPPVVELQ